MQECLFSKRLHIVTVLFFCCFAVIILRTLYLGVWAKKHLADISNKMSIRKITIPAHRGTIFDRNGRKLVWTKHRFELWSTLPEGKNFTQKQKEGLRKNFPERSFAEMSDWSVPLCLELKADEIAKLSPLIRTGYPLKIRTVRQRMKLNRPIVEKHAGDMRDGIGISGWELEYDSILRGKNGKCQVIIDRRQNWLPGSFKLIAAPEHGKNVNLKIDIESEEKKESSK